ncbi:hypothetical protein RD792_009965 [Penstemon davidsonii]|uniref:Uncharacterized protein n=1 Tax=Penstemon davidsonii TaxID=160366 RepID=A0ABR0D0P7_9LAMI|nr:hypothetical protein RD792_009965 [Penstemon davidsonii]
MSACCRRLTAATPAASHHIPRRLSSSINFLHVNHRKEHGIVLRSRRWVIEAAAVGPRGVEEEHKKSGPHRCCSCDGDALVVMERNVDRRVEVMVAAAATVVLGVGNRVLYKLALVPLKQYPFFLAQLATFGYVIVYFSILYLRYQSGKVTDEMLSLPKTPLIAVGLLEALAAASGMAAGAGVIITVASGSGTGSLMETGIFWSVLMIISFLFQAADTVLKETIFLDAAQRLKGGTVDLFVVNSHGSAYQALFICILLPFLSNLWGIPFSQLPSYLKDGAACFLNVGTMSNKCDGAPLLPLLFIIVNMGFNVSLLHLLKISSAVVSCLASTFSVPISVYLFTLPLPYLGVASSLPPGFVVGTIILVVGVFIYTWRRPSLNSSSNTSLAS